MPNTCPHQWRWECGTPHSVDGHVSRMHPMGDDSVVGRATQVSLVMSVPVVVAEILAEVTVRLLEVERFDVAVNGDDEPFEVLG